MEESIKSSEIKEYTQKSHLLFDIKTIIMVVFAISFAIILYTWQKTSTENEIQRSIITARVDQALAHIQVIEITLATTASQKDIADIRKELQNELVSIRKALVELLGQNRIGFLEKRLE